MAWSAAAIDTRIKATVTSTMYDMTRVNANDYFDEEDSAEQRDNKRHSLNQQRINDFVNNSYSIDGGVLDPLPNDAPEFVISYHDYYKTDHGYHSRSLNSNNGWNITTPLSLLNSHLLDYSNEIKSAVLLVHGDKVHSRYFSETAFNNLTGDNKALLIVPNSVHTDLYDNLDKIPFDSIESFLNKYL